MSYNNIMVAAMVVAMMLPLTIPILRHVAFSSLWNRRHRSMALFAVGYLAVWLAAELGIVLILALLERSVGLAVSRIGIVAVAVLWETSSRKTVMIRRCGRTLPLAPRGWRADADCMRFGIIIGMNCVGSCWALMSASTALAHYPLVMVTAFFVEIRGFTDGTSGLILLSRYRGFTLAPK
jgi:predicted metal-binding membrane protein